MRDRRFYKLDNSAKIMPSMTNNLNTNVFRITCSLKEAVNVEILNRALSEACEEFPMFLCTMKSGLFWHYLETSNIKPTVSLENTSPCSKLEGKQLFKVTYYKSRINLDVYHVLADGTGAMEFLKYLVACYLDEKYGLDAKDAVNTASVYAKESDDFKRFEGESRKIKRSQNKRAYKLKFPRKENTIGDVIELHMKAEEMKDLAHKYDCTVTVYLVAMILLSIMKSARVKDLRRPIGITVPIDLRGIFPSETTRNFFYTISIQYKYNPGDKLEDIISFLKSKFASEFSKENLQALLDSYMILEKILLIRIIPNVLKDFILGLITGFRNTETMTLSNLGVIKMPEVYADHIESFSGLMSTNDIHLTTMSYRDELRLGFMTHFTINEIERNMVLLLEEQGIKNIAVVSNKE